MRAYLSRTFLFFLSSAALLCASDLSGSSTAYAQDGSGEARKEKKSSGGESYRKKRDDWEALVAPICCGDPFGDQSPRAPRRSRNEVQEVIRPKLSEIETCAAKEGPHGPVFAKFTIHPDGSVSILKIFPEKFANTEVGACVEAVVKTFQFRKLGAEAGDVTVNYPFKIGSKAEE